MQSRYIPTARSIACCSPVPATDRVAVRAECAQGVVLVGTVQQPCLVEQPTDSSCSDTRPVGEAGRETSRPRLRKLRRRTRQTTHSGLRLHRMAPRTRRPAHEPVHSRTPRQTRDGGETGRLAAVGANRWAARPVPRPLVWPRLPRKAHRGRRHRLAQLRTESAQCRATAKANVTATPPIIRSTCCGQRFSPRAPRGQSRLDFQADFTSTRSGGLLEVCAGRLSIRRGGAAWAAGEGLGDGRQRVPIGAERGGIG